MVPWSAVGCSNSFTNNNFSFHRLPKSIELCKKWLQAIKWVDTEEDRKVVLCSAHFNPEDFKRDLKVSERQCSMLYFFIYDLL